MTQRKTTIPVFQTMAKSMVNKIRHFFKVWAGDFDILNIQVREDIQKNAVKYQPMSGLRLVRSGDKRIPYGQVLFCEIFTNLELFYHSGTV